ncbi:Annexin [Handroanthus impetiginosus]|uniref:Annexin n=1 Tax=Handroanthus impetiginosus TaxID=429701 RepID=A0A2G9GT36_9LAMI|nr:Annexin [Handroanthus impetiginosus]
MATKSVGLSRTKSFESICKEIHDSWGEKKVLIQVLVGLSHSESREVRETYMKIYGEDFIELCQNFDQALSSLSSLMLSPFERDAVVAREALYQNDSVNYKALIEIFTCRKSSHVLLILQAYLAKYRRPLDLDIASIEPPHPYQKILKALSASHKAHPADISQHIAKCDSRRLYQTGEGNLGAIDEAVVLEIFSKRSISQLKLTFFSYKHIYGHNYTSFLKNEELGEFGGAVRVVAKCICSPAGYYAKTLYGCLKGRTTDKGTMERIMVSRADVDMDEIQRDFKKKYGEELRNAICDSIPEGNYRDFLVALVTKISTC